MSIWPALLDSMITLNYKVLRFHSSPAPEWLVEECDRKGMLVIYESAIFCREYVPTQNTTYVQNASKYQKEIIRTMRNHPSIIIWSAENEMIFYGGTKFTIPQILQYGQQ